MYQSDQTYSASELQQYFHDIEFDVELTPDSKSRNIDQNRFYWGYLIRPLADFFDTPKQEMHEVMKHRFLVDFKGLRTNDGMSCMPFVCSTTTLSEAEFDQYCQHIRSWALDAL